MDAIGKPFSQDFLNQAAAATKEAGRGEIHKMVRTDVHTNMAQLMRGYNNVANEGGEGYMPDFDYFKEMPEYKEWENVKELIPA